jgi:bifunctional non-homologous end joining protein LigD
MLRTLGAPWPDQGIVSKRRNSPYRSGRSPDWIKSKNPDAPAVKREADEDWGR